MKGIFAAMLLFVSFWLTAQDSLVIPAGVAYKKKTAEVNSRARTLLLMELNENTVTYSLFDASVFMGPLLWKRYKEMFSFMCPSPIRSLKKYHRKC